jgi:CRISPR-associated endonuclease/helicase Cas3
MAKYELPEGPIVASSEGEDLNGNPIPPQLYRNHVAGVMDKASRALAGTMRFYRGPCSAEALHGSVMDAAWLHDLGKLMVPFQLAMKGFGPMSERGNHVHAGVALLLQAYAEKNKMTHAISAAFVEGHHVGLLNDGAGWQASNPNEPKKPRKRSSRRMKSASGAAMRPFDFLLQEPGTVNHGQTPRYVLDHIGEMFKVHCSELPKKITRANLDIDDMDAIDMRILFSVLVDSDHMDASGRFSKWPLDDFDEVELQPETRLERLIEHVERIRQKEMKGRVRRTRRNIIRDRLFQECMECDPKQSFYMLSAAVGSGKTFASSALALRIAEAQGLRHYYHVSPFINTTSQTANALRNAFRLGSDQQETDMAPFNHDPAERSVAEHHHVAGYDNWIAANFGKLWRAPVTCVTAVQFFETILSGEVHRLRKLHQLPGSVIVLDEFDNSFPAHLWPIIASTLKTLNEKWGCVFIFCSGTPIRPWLSEHLNIDPLEIHEVVSEELSANMMDMERHRAPVRELVREGRTHLFDGTSLLRRISQFRGPRLCILQTMRNAALLAHYAREMRIAPREDIYHISSALSKHDRARILSEIKERLNNRDEIIVFATSVLETGIDLSFRHAFSEARSVTACLQVAGRVNRHGEYNGISRGVHCFVLTEDNIFPFTSHQDFVESRDHLLEDLRKEPITIDNCQSAFNRFAESKASLALIEAIREADATWDMRKVDHLTKVINNSYVPVMVDAELFHRIMNDELGDMTAGELSRRFESACVSVEFHYLAGWDDGGEDSPSRSARYQFISLEDVQSEQLHHRASTRFARKPESLLIWDGLYDSDFYGYMAQELVRLGIMSSEGFSNPADGLRDWE